MLEIGDKLRDTTEAGDNGGEPSKCWLSERCSVRCLLGKGARISGWLASELMKISLSSLHGYYSCSTHALSWMEAGGPVPRLGLNDWQREGVSAESREVKERECE
jgi:hypothetical protein